MLDTDIGWKWVNDQCSSHEQTGQLIRYINIGHSWIKLMAKLLILMFDIKTIVWKWVNDQCCPHEEITQLIFYINISH